MASMQIEGRRVYVATKFGEPCVEPLKRLGAHWDAESRRWWIGAGKKDEAILKAHDLDPRDPVQKAALADRLEEVDYPEIAFAVRWMGWRCARPGFRDGEKLRKKWVWYLEGGYMHDREEAARMEERPFACLPYLAFVAIRGPHANTHLLYHSWAGAVGALAEGPDQDEGNAGGAEMIHEPTPADLALDLERVHADVVGYDNHLRNDRFSVALPHALSLIAMAQDTLPAVIRRCLAAEARVAELERDLAEARRVAQGLPDRCAEQSELLSRRAEK